MSELADFCARLSRLRAESGDPTLVWLSRQPWCPSKSQLSKIFRGEVPGLPDADVVRGIVAACAHWARRRGHHPLLPADERHWLIERDIVERRLADRPAQAPPTGIRRGTECTLPRDLATLTGRDAELADLLAVVRRQHRVLPIQELHGMPGVGKTALAVHAAHVLAQDFPDGQFFVDLRGHTRDQVPVAPADALVSLLLATGMDARAIPAEPDARATLWRERMAGRTALVLLDNARSDEQVRPLLPNSPRCLVLVTSRHRLAALQDTHAITLEVLGPQQATELFLRLIGPREDDSAAVAEIVELCGYLPLAITLLAGRLRHRPLWTLRYLADRVGAALRSTGDRLGEFRADNAAVEIAFRLSYDNLTADAQRLFRRLALHTGMEFDARAAAALDGAPLADTATRLEALYDDHLLIETAPGRYRFHDLLRHYAADLAGRHEDLRMAARDRLLGYYLHAARAATECFPRAVECVGNPAPAPESHPDIPLPVFDGMPEALHWLETEHDNLFATCTTAADAERPEAVSLALALYPYLRQVGHYRQAILLYRRMLPVARESERAHVLYRLGFAQRVTTAWAAARDSLSRACAEFAARAEEANLAVARYELGGVLSHQSAFAEAVRVTEDARAAFARLGNVVGQALATARLGVLCRLTADRPGSFARLFEAVELLKSVDDPYCRNFVFGELSLVYLFNNQYDEAEIEADKAYAAAVEAGDIVQQKNTITTLSMIRSRQGDNRGSLRHARRGLEIAEQIGDELGAINALNCAGAALINLAEWTEAGRVLRMALDRAEALDSEYCRGVALRQLGTFRHRTGDLAGARQVLAAAVEQFGRMPDLTNQARTLSDLADVELELGDVVQADTHYAAARPLAELAQSETEAERAAAGVARCSGSAI